MTEVKNDHENNQLDSIDNSQDKSNEKLISRPQQPLVIDFTCKNHKQLTANRDREYKTYRVPKRQKSYHINDYQDFEQPSKYFQGNFSKNATKNTPQLNNINATRPHLQPLQNLSESSLIPSSEKTQSVDDAKDNPDDTQFFADSIKKYKLSLIESAQKYSRENKVDPLFKRTEDSFEASSQFISQNEKISENKEILPNDSDIHIETHFRNLIPIFQNLSTKKTILMTQWHK